jgi:Tfp pilus assembly protein PilF
MLYLFLFCFVFLYACVPVEQKKTDTENADYHYLMGVTALKEQNPTAALKEFLEAEKYSSENPEIHAGLAEAYIQKKAFDLAEKHYQKAIQISDNDPRYYNNLGALYLLVERYDDAIAAFKVAAENLLFDRPELSWTGVGVANVQKQDYVAAKNAYEKAMDLNPRYYRAPFLLGELYYNQDRPVEALEMFDRSLAVAPNFAVGYYWKGLVHMKMKETENAKQAFLEVLKLAPETEVSRLAANYLKIISQ